MANCDSRGSAHSAFQQKKIQVQRFKCKQFEHKANACINTSSHSAAAVCVDHRVKHFIANGENNRDERKIEKVDVDQESDRQVHKPRPLLKTAKIDTGSMKCEVLGEEQKDDETLQNYWNLAKTKEQDACKASFQIKKDLLYRVYEDKYNRVKVMHIMALVKFQEKVMQVAHDGLLLGHFGNRKTLERILTHFYFSGIHEAVRWYVWSCDCC
jgi:Integrase zinc binding domain